MSDFTGKNNTKVVDTNGPAGQVTFHLGKDGRIAAYDKPWDFDKKGPGGRTLAHEAQTAFGRYFVPGKVYKLIFIGTVMPAKE